MSESDVEHGEVPPREIRRQALRAAFPALAAAAIAAALAACKSTPESEAPKPSAPPPIGARLTQVAFSTVTGLVGFAPYPGGLVVTAAVMNIPPGRSRVAIHANGNCSSPNGFSAGPPLLIPGSSEPAMVWITSDGDNSRRSLTVRLPGLTLDAIRGRSVVVHAGAGGSLDAQPDVRNNRVACGVIEAMRPLF